MNSLPALGYAKSSDYSSWGVWGAAGWKTYADGQTVVLSRPGSFRQSWGGGGLQIGLSPRASGWATHIRV